MKNSCHLDGEIWKESPEYSGSYLISNLGRIKSIPRSGSSGKIRQQQVGKDGYLSINLSHLGKKKRRRAHQLVMTSFVGPIPFGKQINHKNGIKTDNRIENLEYVTISENAIHAFETGLRKPPKTWLKKTGENNFTSIPVAQLKNGQVISEFDSATFASAATGICRQHISQCCSGTRKIAGGFTWKHLPKKYKLTSK